MDLKQKRYLIAFLFHLGLLAVAVSLMYAGSYIPTLVDIGGFILIFETLTFRRLPLDRLLQQKLLREFRHRCGFVVPLRSSWRHFCGYTNPPMHAFSRCQSPDCERGFSFIVCQCGEGIPITFGGTVAHEQSPRRR